MRLDFEPLPEDSRVALAEHARFPCHYREIGRRHSTQFEHEPRGIGADRAPELLDAAAARRFLFKVRFLPMTADQIAKAFRRSFGADPPRFVLRLSGVTPADFAIVARKASVLGERDPRILTQWLETEAQAKPDAGRRRIGF